MLTLICKECNSSFQRKQIYRNCKNTFCSRSCACKYNNTANNFPKRHLTKQCKDCNKLIPSKWVRCKECREKIVFESKLDTLSLKEYLEEYGHLKANRYTLIRVHARKSVRNRIQECINCGYNKHVECCHIKDIKDFNKNCLISEINNQDNLVLLCRNCHWEFDNKLLTLGT